MPQISKDIPIKSYQNIPAVYASQEYMTYLGRVHAYYDYDSLEAAENKRYIWYHATRPYKLSFSIWANEQYYTSFYSSVDTDLPSIITPITDQPICTNRWKPTEFDLDIGTIDEAVNTLAHFITISPEWRYQFKFGEELEEMFICKPAVYYILRLKNEDVSARLCTTRIVYTDFLGVS